MAAWGRRDSEAAGQPAQGGQEPGQPRESGPSGGEPGQGEGAGLPEAGASPTRRKRWLGVW